jgi:hypothetical protein
MAGAMLALSDAIFPSDGLQILNPPIPGVATHPRQDFGRVPHWLHGTAGGTIQNMKQLTPDLDAAFQDLYATGDWRCLEQPAIQFFTVNPTAWDAHDHYFEHFTGIWRRLLSAGDYSAAETIWQQAFAPVFRWEQANPNKRVHKGTGYYFWGMTALLRGALDRGYLLIHQALEEDKTTHGNISPSTPALALVSLNDSDPRQAFIAWVREQVVFLKDLLGNYTTTWEILLVE